MDTVRNRLIPLEEIPADRRLVEELFRDGKISPRARDYALDLLYPARNWGLWISRVLAGLGTALVLAGIVYFYAFNWNAIPDLVKLGSVELAMAGAMAAALLRGLDRTSGKFLALAAATLIGVFLAVFGQVYQTGADAWELFAGWALLILPFGVAAAFAPIFGLWLVVANLALFLYWNQMHPWRFHLDEMIFPILSGFNVAVLALRESVEKRLPWLRARWTRNLPALIGLTCAVIPCAWAAVDWNWANTEVPWAAGIGALILAGFYGIYRYYKLDVQALAATILCVCLVAECLLFRILDIGGHGNAGMLLLMGVLTVGLFAGVIVWLRNLTKQLEVSPWLNI